MHIDPTGWYPLEQYSPVREGWYEVQLVSGETAFAKYSDGKWTEKPPLVFTHWRGLSKDPSKVRDAETFGADVAAAEGVRAVWNAFFPGAGNEAHKPM
ncbi:conserved protein of unknown function [Pararobbsia alpina]|jgi:hypothetical protein|uniref:hypothetical protein n=1 Tax=Pararobbsia alpina TaxID=621374 RepID=UPI0039A63D82